jgi:hypothetical protein
MTTSALDGFATTTDTTTRFAPSTNSLRALAALAGLVVGVVYLVAITYATPFIHLDDTLTFLPARLAVAGFVVAVLIAAFRAEVEPVLWSVGYVAGLAIAMAVGKVFFGDASFFAYLYTSGGAMIAFVAGVQWVDQNV